MTVYVPSVASGGRLLREIESSPLVSPNGDGINDEASIAFAVAKVEGAAPQVAIYDLSGHQVRIVAPGADGYLWDGDAWYGGDINRLVLKTEGEGEFGGALEDAEIKYSTVQNWFPGDEEGKGGIYNFVTKRGKAFANAKVTWTQVETGSAITWKYPSCILQGDNSVGEFYSVAVTNNRQQADTGTKMVHLGKNTRSTIISKGISAGKGQNTYRGLVRIGKGARGARNFSQCDSLLIGDRCGAHTFPYLEVKNTSSQVEHEASTSKIGEDQIFYCRQRGLSTEDAVNLIVNGFCKEVFRELPMEFAVEAQKLLGVSLEGSVG